VCKLEKEDFTIFFLHLYVLGRVCSLESVVRKRDVTAAQLDTCMANHVAEIVRNLLEAKTLTRATYTHVKARNAEGRRKSEYDKQHQLKRKIELQQSEIELEIPKTYT